jgi:hypothetical protein
MEELEVLLRSFLTLALDETKWSSSRSGRFISDIHLVGEWVGTQSGDGRLEEQKLPCVCQYLNHGPSSP